MEQIPVEKVVPQERIEGKIYIIRGKKVMVDSDLAILYGVKTQVLNQAVRRNSGRFPSDFMFQISLDEAKSLISHFVISKVGRGGVRKLPLVFTEQGIAMLSSVLKSDRAIMVNIQIIRTFTMLREMIAENDQLRLRLDALESRYDKQFRSVFDAIRSLLAAPEPEPTPEIGFRTEVDGKR